MTSKVEPLVWVTEQHTPGHTTLKPNSKHWPQDAQIIGIRLNLRAMKTYELDPFYAKGLHAWFLDQVRQTDPDLSAYLHDGKSEKAFTLSRLMGSLQEQRGRLLIPAQGDTSLQITGLTEQVVAWLRQWVTHLPAWLELRGSPLQIVGWEMALPPIKYVELAHLSDGLTLSFVSPTSFHHRGHHLPLPIPRNLFQSYLRRWNDFSGCPVEMDAFLEAVDGGVVITRHRLESVKTTAGRQGAVTGFVGCVELGLSGRLDPVLKQRILSLVRYAPYCGTGHKTAFGLGQTRWGWLGQQTIEVSAAEEALAERIRWLMELFRGQRVRQGGARAEKTAQLWSIILARRERGESLALIAEDLEMPYETVKTYVKLARRAAQGEQG